ncbi:hypothetical protein ABPG75_008639 [Micractinium tetrahymenae]
MSGPGMPADRHKGVAPTIGPIPTTDKAAAQSAEAREHTGADVGYRMGQVLPGSGAAKLQAAADYEEHAAHVADTGTRPMRRDDPVDYVSEGFPANAPSRRVDRMAGDAEDAPGGSRA